NLFRQQFEHSGQLPPVDRGQIHHHQQYLAGGQHHRQLFGHRLLRAPLRQRQRRHALHFPRLRRRLPFPHHHFHAVLAEPYASPLRLPPLTHPRPPALRPHARRRVDRSSVPP